MAYQRLVARELMKLLGYTSWQHFAEVMDDAMEVCRINGSDDAVTQTFTHTSNVSGHRAANEAMERPFGS